MKTRQQRGPGLTWTEGDIDSVIDDAILTTSVSYSMDMATEITVSVLDRNFEMARRNYFWVTRDVWWTSDTVHGFSEYSYQGGSKQHVQQLMEIASAGVNQGPAASPVWELQLRTKAIQQMKRDRSRTKEYVDNAATGYVKRTAEEFGLIPVIQYSNEGHAHFGNFGDIKQFKYGEERGESTWDVIARLKGSAKGDESDAKQRTNYVAFEANGYFFFCSQAWLLGKWGTETATGGWMNPKTSQRELREFTYVPAEWPSPAHHLIQLHQIPNIRRSDNDPLEVTGSMQVDRANGTSLRPGMTIHLTLKDDTGAPIDGLGGFFLIDRVDYTQMSSDSVSVNFRSPERAEGYIREYALEGMTSATRP